MSKVKTKLECPKCNNLFSTRGNNYKKHINSCNGSYNPFVKLVSCKYCNISFHEDMSASFRANHSRWCDKNPKRSEYNKNTEIMRSGITEESRKKQREGVSKAHADGKYDQSYEKRRGKSGTPHTEETKQILREKALASSHRRLIRSIRKYIKKDGTVVMLDSSWEEALAKRLDETGVEWIRPENPISYIASDGKKHNYFPDFYLPEYDLYLDPKNPAAMIAQANKIACLKKTMHNLILIDSLDDCLNFGPIA